MKGEEQKEQNSVGGKTTKHKAKESHHNMKPSAVSDDSQNTEDNKGAKSSEKGSDATKPGEKKVLPSTDFGEQKGKAQQTKDRSGRDEAIGYRDTKAPNERKTPASDSKSRDIADTDKFHTTKPRKRKSPKPGEAKDPSKPEDKRESPKAEGYVQGYESEDAEDSEPPQRSFSVRRAFAVRPHSLQCQQNSKHADSAKL